MIQGHGDDAYRYGRPIRANFSSNVYGHVDLAPLKAHLRARLDAIGNYPEPEPYTLEKALALSPTHLSCYGLIVEEGTPLKARIDRGEWQLPEEAAERDMYELCRATLAEHGFRQYEISNFALPGRACRHNVDCWHRKEYLGVGSAACGFLDGVRYQNPPALEDYLRGAPAKETVLSPEDARFESVMLGLRLTEGLSEEAFESMHGMTLDEAFPGKMDRSIRAGLLRRENGFLTLTRRGMDLQNRVLVDFL